jgi:hypothetical protein
VTVWPVTLSRAVADPTPSGGFFAVRAVHNVELLFWVRVFKSSKTTRRRAMGIAIEVNVALWIMIGCGLAELARLVGYLF